MRKVWDGVQDHALALGIPPLHADALIFMAIVLVITTGCACYPRHR